MSAVGSVGLAVKVLESSAPKLEIIDRILCKECAIEIYGNDFVRDAALHPSDATFRCPALGREGSCKSEAVSYRQFFTGSCCEPALRWLTKNEKGKICLLFILFAKQLLFKTFTVIKDSM